MPAATAVVLDCDGTLVVRDRPYDRLLRDAAAAAGLPEPAREAFAAAYDDAFFEAFDSFADDPVREGVVAGLDDVPESARSAVDPDALAAAVRDHDVAATEPRSGARAAVERLAAAGPVGVLTNGEADQQRRKLRRHGLCDPLDAYVPSYEVGAHKPSPATFAAAAERLPARRHVYVGDDPEADVEGARAAGWDAVHVREDDDVRDRLAGAGLL